MPTRLSAMCVASPPEMSSSVMWLANAADRGVTSTSSCKLNHEPARRP
jgi:hypothetical protein